jgi:hypothetical protein
LWTFDRVNRNALWCKGCPEGLYQGPALKRAFHSIIIQKQKLKQENILRPFSAYINDINEFEGRAS